MRYRVYKVLLETPMVSLPPIVGTSCPNIQFVAARRNHYGTNMVTIIIQPLSPSIYHLTRQIHA